MLLAEQFDDARQQVQDGGAVGGDVQFAGVQPGDLVVEGRLQTVDALDQRLGQLVQQLPLAAGTQAPAAALEQHHPQVSLQRLQLQGDGRLADEQRLGRPRYRAQPDGLAERPQGLQPVRLVGKSQRGRAFFRHFG